MIKWGEKEEQIQETIMRTPRTNCPTRSYSPNSPKTANCNRLLLVLYMALKLCLPTGDSLDIHYFPLVSVHFGQMPLFEKSKECNKYGIFRAISELFVCTVHVWYRSVEYIGLASLREGRRLYFRLNPTEAAKANNYMDTIYFIIWELTRIYVGGAYKWEYCMCHCLGEPSSNSFVEKRVDDRRDILQK